MPAPRKTTTARHKPPAVKPGPNPGVLKIQGTWEAAVKQSFRKKKPARGWPKK